ncbi:MAG: urease accessory protein UreD [Clostridiales Family XIII bacterium]|nr:urease accessory protein UreD [Clostridiales Family XIII bacterium]
MSAEGKLSLRFRRDADAPRTRLAEQYYKLPLQVLPPHYPDESGTAFVYLLNPTGGVLAGDRLETELVLEEGASVVVETPSASKIYRAEERPAGEFEEDASPHARTHAHAHAETRLNVTLAPCARLEYIPRHAIPYAGSALRQENRFFLDGDAALIAYDAFSSGRKARGESFAFTSYESTTEIHVDGALALLDRIRLAPGETDVSGIGLMEGRYLCASFYLYQKDFPSEAKAAVEDILKQSGLPGGLTRLTPSLSVVRMLADDMILFDRAAREVRDTLHRLLARPILRLHSAAPSSVLFPTRYISGERPSK